MCPYSVMPMLLLALVVLFFMFWIPRQYRNVKENFSTFAQLIESPQESNYFFDCIMTISGYYRGRKAGWSFRIFQDNQRCTWLYIEPHCKLKPRYITISDPTPTKHTVLRGKRIYFVREVFQDLIAGGLLRDSLPLFTKEDIVDMLEELNSAAEIVETRPEYTKANS